MAAGEPASIEVLKSAHFPDLQAALEAYLQHVGNPEVKVAGIAIATPITGDRVSMTNHDWSFSIKALKAALRLERLEVVNDFVALAWSVPVLEGRWLRQIGPGRAVPDAPRVIIGPGTGLGVGGLVRAPGGEWQTVASEGGHTSFSPTSEFETRVLQYCWREHSHVSFERLVSGPGLALLYRALCHLQGEPALDLEAAAIVAQAQGGTDARCREAVQLFCRLLGSFAANVALTYGSTGGVYLSGGVLEHLGSLFDEAGFRAGFEAKGRFATYLAPIPTSLVTAPYPALLGMAALLARGSTHQT